MKRLFTFLGLVLSLGSKPHSSPLLSACRAEEPPAQPLILRGQVTTTSGRALPSARVFFWARGRYPPPPKEWQQESTATTDGTGSFSWRVPAERLQEFVKVTKSENLNIFVLPLGKGWNWKPASHFRESGERYDADSLNGNCARARIQGIGVARLRPKTAWTANSSTPPTLPKLSKISLMVPAIYPPCPEWAFGSAASGSGIPPITSSIKNPSSRA